MNTKDFYLTVGIDNTKKLRLPRNQYGLEPSPGKNIRKKIHRLEILPPAIRLNKDEKELVEKLKVLVFKSMPSLVRRKQPTVSGKKASAVAPQSQSVTAALPSSLAEKTTSSTAIYPTTRNSKSAILGLILKSLTRFVTEEGGTVCVNRLGYTAKMVELSIERYEKTREEKTTPATPERVSSEEPRQPAPPNPPVTVSEEKESVTKTLADMVSMLANYKTRSVEVVRGYNEETQTVIFPPRTRNEVSFIDQARRSGWIEDATPEQHHRRGMLMYFARYWKDDFDNVAREERKLKQTHTMETYTTESMIRSCNLTGKQFKEIKGTLLARSNLSLELQPEKLKDLEKGPEPFFKVYKYCQQGKDPEKVKLWTTDVCEEVEHAIDQRYCEMIEEERTTSRRKQLTKNLPSLDYDLPPSVNGGPRRRGITALQGGDHGDVAFRIHYQFHLSSPQERKARGSASYACPLAQVAFAECKKDKFELLDGCGMMQRLEECKERFVSSCAITVHSKTDTSKLRTYLLPKDVDLETLRIEASPDGVGRRLLWKVGNEEQVRELDPKFHSDSPWNLTYLKSVSEFNDLYVGDLEYVCTLIGMNNCAGSSCAWCDLRQGLFGTGKGNERTRQTIDAHYQQHLAKRRVDEERGNKSKTKPVCGVQSHWLLSIDPRKIIIPTLHVELGLINKFNDEVTAWMQLNVEGLTPEWDAIRQSYLEAQEKETNLRIEYEQDKLNMDLKQKLTEAANLRKKTKKEYDVMQDEISKREGGFWDHQEDVFHQLGLKHESYFAGKLNGNSCRKQMEKAKEWSEKMAGLTIFNPEQSRLTEVQVKAEIAKFGKILGLFDSIFAQVRGVEAGLLPTEEQILKLEETIDMTGKLWLERGWSTDQPKWHLVFDGHLVDQVRFFWGLADKLDDVIEKAHQPWKREKERTWNIKNFRMQQKQQLAAVRKRNHFKIRAELDKTQQLRKRTFKNVDDRKRKVQEKKESVREAKTVKREGHFAG